MVFLDEDRHMFNPRPNALDRTLQAAQCAVAADPASQLANYALAQAHYFRGDIGAFRAAAERAIGLNRRDGSTMAMLGILFGYSGDWDRGVELTTRAMALNPHHPGWYRFSTFFNEYRQDHYAEALAIAQKINMPEYFATHYILAMTQAQLGNLPAAQEEAKKTLQLWPDFERDFITRHVQKWIPAQPELIEQILEGLGLAGLRVQRPGRVGEDAAGSAREIRGVHNRSERIM